MATRDVFSDEELGQLREFPEIGRAELIRFFTLSAADEAFVRRFRGQGNVLGAAVQLCTLPWLGFVPGEVASAPPAYRAMLPRVPLASVLVEVDTRTGFLEHLVHAGGKLPARPS